MKKPFDHFETRAVRTQAERSPHREHSGSIYMTSSFVFDGAEHARAMFNDEVEGNIYTRFSNPNNNEFIEKLCQLEGTEDGIATASGMAAMFSSMAALLKSGDHVLASRSLFGSTHQILTGIFPKWGIEHTYADLHDPASWEGLIQDNTRMIFVETPSNPGLDLVDLEWLGKLAEAHNLILNVDNCFATPYLQNPASYGAHLVTHSATKFIDGQGRTIAGAVLGREDLIQQIRFFARHTGPALSPFNGWMLSKSLETLHVRMEKHCDNAHRLAEYLEGHKELEFVKYPFLASHPQQALAKKQMRYGGGLITFNVKGGYDRARNFLDNLSMISLTANLGDTRTTATHPASTTHSKLTVAEQEQVNILPGLVRISVGLENVNDILEDIENALRASKLQLAVNHK
ncbi:MAG: aminotransferase class I/II-fold pyridoxal phosphate-dependent enzyme [Cyclobacteriaceae bacterium]